MQVLPTKTDLDTTTTNNNINSNITTSDHQSGTARARNITLAAPTTSDHTQRKRNSFTKSRARPLTSAVVSSNPPAVMTVSNTVTSSTRVYKAPQALVRNDNYVNSKQAATATTTSIGTRRRRRMGGGGTSRSHRSSSSSNPPGGGSEGGFLMDHESDTSVGNVDELPAPPLSWGDDDDFPKISPYSRKKDSCVIPEIAWARSPPSRSNSRQMSPTHVRNGGCGDDNYEYSENTLGEEELFSAYETHLHTHLHTHLGDHNNNASSSSNNNRCCPPPPNNGHNKKRSIWYWCSSHPYANVIQFCVLLLFAFFVFDSHHRVVRKHKIQLQEYDEERAHILEQMMWIDQAAKKVHQKYAQKGGPPGDVLGQLRGTGSGDDSSARAALEKLQVRIQLNARDRLGQRFGDKPAEISLKLNDQGEHLIVALSDDTPHAVSILLEQVERRVWDDIRVEKATAVGAVQIASTKAATQPLLEFVEPSRGCHEVGSMAIRQQEEEELHVLKLRVNLIANSPMEPGDVCLGRVVSSLVVLQEMARNL